MSTESSSKDKIKVECLRRCGLEDRTSEIGEVVMMDKKTAKKLQEAGAIKIVIE